MPEAQPKIIAIIGAGNVGLALARLFADTGVQVVVGSRNPQIARKRIVRLLGADQVLFKITTRRAAVSTADISILAVTDDAIAAVCMELAEHFKRASTVAHCSGALDSRALVGALRRDCVLCSLHPLNTFPNAEAALQLFSTPDHRTYLYCEGDKQALLLALPVFKQAGFETVEISRQAKPLYHAACVFACNYLTVLMDVSLRTAEAGKLDRRTFWKALQPLLQATLGNISEGGTANALSGPIARGDDRTVSKHLRALLAQSEALQLTYTDLGKHALRLVIERGELDDEKIKAIEHALAALQ